MRFSRTEFEEYCKTPNINISGKSKSYANAIEYFLDFLKIDPKNFNEEDLNKIIEYGKLLNSNECKIYIELLNKLTKERRSSYLKKGFIQAALPYFYEFLKSINK